MARQELGELYWKITGDSSSFDKSLNKSESSMGKLGKGVATAGLAIVGALAAAGAAAFKLAKDAGESADKLLDLEQVTGLSTDTLQEFKFIAAEAGVSFEGLTGAAQKFTAKIPLIESGTGDAAESFAKLGVDLRDANGELRSQDELFPELINSLQGVENITERNAIAQQLFGRSLGDLAPVLGMTEEQFAALRLEANEVGVVLSKTALESANNFRASLDTLAVQSETTKTAIGATLAPIFQSTLIPALEKMNSKLTEVANNFTEFTQSAEGIEKISDIAGRVTGSFAAIGAVAEPILDSLKGALGDIITPFQELNEESEGAGIGFQLLAGAGAIISGALNILGTVIGAAINNLVNLYEVATSTADLVGAAWDRLKGNITKEEFQAQLAETGDAFTELGVEVVEGIGDSFNALGSAVTGFIGNQQASAETIANAYITTAESTKEIVAGTLQNIVDNTEVANDMIVEDQIETNNELADSYITDEEIFNNILDKRVENYRQAMSSISDATAAVGGAIISIWDSVNTFRENSDNAELQRLENSIEATEEGTAQRAAAEEALEQKKKTLAREQAKREKNQAIFSAIINTSTAVIKMLADPGGVTGIVLSALAAATGIAEVAAISSQPLPSAEQGATIPSIPGVPASGDQQVYRVNGGEKIVPADESTQPTIFEFYLDGEVFARSTINNYVNKGRVPIDLTRAAM